jgi:hypothetical protein
VTPSWAHVALTGCAVSLLNAATAMAQPLSIPEIAYPTLPAQAASAAGFVPAGWRQEILATGDLNDDGIDDLALLLRNTAPKNVLDNRGLGPSRFDTNPRILAVAFGQPGQGGYSLALQDHTLIRRPVTPTLEDAIAASDDIVIRRGTLRVTQHLFANAGSYGTSRPTFTFRWQNSRFELIGYDSVAMNRGSGEMETVSINYSTRRATVALGHIENDEEKSRRLTIPARPLLSLSEIGDGLDFDPALPGQPGIAPRAAWP